jgi:hypothetical protein
MRTLELDSLLGDAHPDATFHDAELQDVSLHFERGVAELFFRVPTAVVDGDIFYGEGTLTLTGLLFFAAEPPRTTPDEWEGSALWITNDGSFPDPTAKTSLALPPGLPDDAFCQYLFSSNTNSFLLVAATGASFEWATDSDERTPPPTDP